MKQLKNIYFIPLLLWVNSMTAQTIDSKVVFYNYNEFNSRITNIFSSDTLIVSLKNIGNSIHSYQSTGYLDISLQVNTETKAARYENGFYDENGYDEKSRKSIRDAFEVRYVDNKIFEYNDYKYFVYRLLVTNKKVNDCDFLVFWSKDYGILMQKDLHVDGLIRFDNVSDEQKNIMIRHLSYFIFSDNNFGYLKDWGKY
tara:strand:- start:1408 stop:2004 length:597 start_codon:yes stop_codon:yes gene_type:complete